MQHFPLLLDGALATLTAVLYAYVGSVTLRRETSDEPSRRAVRLFAIWWFGLAAITVVGTLRTALVAMGFTDLLLHNVVTWLTIVPLVGILWGLVSYLGYIYTGSQRIFTISTIFHAALLVALAYLVAVRPATGITITNSRVELQYATDLPGPVTGVLITAIILPALAAAIGYASLYFRTHDRSARYRIAMVSGAFVMWFGLAAVAGVTPLGDLAWWPIASRIIALVATLMVLAAYQPPRWARDAFGVRSALQRSDADRDRRMRLARSTLLRLSGAS